MELETMIHSVWTCVLLMMCTLLCTNGQTEPLPKEACGRKRDVQLHLSCTEDSVIQVVRALYGHDNGSSECRQHKCETSVAVEYPQYYTDITNECNHQVECSVDVVTTSTLCDDHYQLADYVVVEYRCIAEELAPPKEACGQRPNKLFLSCTQGRVIQVVRALYGQDNDGPQCRNRRGDRQCEYPVESYNPSYYINITNTCNHQSRCFVHVESVEAHCTGSPEYTDYVVVEYECVYEGTTRKVSTPIPTATTTPSPTTSTASATTTATPTTTPKPTTSTTTPEMTSVTSPSSSSITTTTTPSSAVPTTTGPIHVACSETTLFLECNEGKVIHVIDANFGKDEDELKCEEGVNCYYDVKKSDPAYYQEIISSCKHEANCSVDVQTIEGAGCGNGITDYVVIEYLCIYVEHESSSTTSTDTTVFVTTDGSNGDENNIMAVVVISLLIVLVIAAIIVVVVVLYYRRSKHQPDKDSVIGTSAIDEEDQSNTGSIRSTQPKKLTAQKSNGYVQSNRTNNLSSKLSHTSPNYESVPDFPLPEGDKEASVKNHETVPALPNNASTTELTPPKQDKRVPSSASGQYDVPLPAYAVPMRRNSGSDDTILVDNADYESSGFTSPVYAEPCDVTLDNVPESVLVNDSGYAASDASIPVYAVTMRNDEDPDETLLVDNAQYGRLSLK